MARDTGMGAKTKPLVNGVGAHAVATGVAPGTAHTGAPSADLGYTVNLLPKNDSLPVQVPTIWKLGTLEIWKFQMSNLLQKKTTRKIRSYT